MQMRIWLVAASINAALMGCASNSGDGDTILPPPERSMGEVYHSAVGSGSDTKLYDERSALRRAMTEPDADLSEFVRTEDDALKNAFPVLPNPEMRTFVAPHLSTRDGVPIPGYVTRWPMYTTTIYALPGEASINYRSN